MKGFSSKPKVGLSIALRASYAARNFPFLLFALSIHSTFFFPDPLQICSGVGLEQLIGFFARDLLGIF